MHAVTMPRLHLCGILDQKDDHDDDEAPAQPPDGDPSALKRVKREPAVVVGDEQPSGLTAPRVKVEPSPPGGGAEGRPQDEANPAGESTPPVKKNFDEVFSRELNALATEQLILEIEGLDSEAEDDTQRDAPQQAQAQGRGGRGRGGGRRGGRGARGRGNGRAGRSAAHEPQSPPPAEPSGGVAAAVQATLDRKAWAKSLGLKVFAPQCEALAAPEPPPADGLWDLAKLGPPAAAKRPPAKPPAKPAKPPVSQPPAPAPTPPLTPTVPSLADRSTLVSLPAGPEKVAAAASENTGASANGSSIPEGREHQQGGALSSSAAANVGASAPSGGSPTARGDGGAASPPAASAEAPLFTGATSKADQVADLRARFDAVQRRAPPPQVKLGPPPSALKGLICERLRRQGGLWKYTEADERRLRLRCFQNQLCKMAQQKYQDMVVKASGSWEKFLRTSHGYRQIADWADRKALEQAERQKPK